MRDDFDEGQINIHIRVAAILTNNTSTDNDSGSELEVDQMIAGAQYDASERQESAVNVPRNCPYNAQRW